MHKTNVVSIDQNILSFQKLYTLSQIDSVNARRVVIKSTLKEIKHDVYGLVSVLNKQVWFAHASCFPNGERCDAPPAVAAGATCESDTGRTVHTIASIRVYTV